MSIIDLPEMGETRLFIVRHAEARKNLEKMHGGGTQDLTARGTSDLVRQIDVLKSLTNERDTIVIYQKEGRSQYTAEIIAQALGAEMVLANKIYGVGLGIISELNEDELEKEYPDVARILADWKNSGANLRDYPNIPGREHMNDFAIRIRDGLEQAIRPHKDNIIVGTTSTINMINHLMITGGEFIRDEYRFVSFPFAGINGWLLRHNEKPEKIFTSF